MPTKEKCNAPWIKLGKNAIYVEFDKEKKRKFKEKK